MLEQTRLTFFERVRRSELNGGMSSCLVAFEQPLTKSTRGPLISCATCAQAVTSQIDQCTYPTIAVIPATSGVRVSCVGKEPGSPASGTRERP
jgi:hypothetical protein